MVACVGVTYVVHWANIPIHETRAKGRYDENRQLQQTRYYPRKHDRAKYTLFLNLVYVVKNTSLWT